MTAALDKATRGSNANASAHQDPLGGLLGAFFGGSSSGGGGRESQVPVLSCDKPLDLNTRVLF